MIRPAVLTIAGSDSGGNAGIQADLRTFHAYCLHGCSVITALTAQNPFKVSAIHLPPVDFVAAQLDAVLGVYNIKALKIGMLSDPEVIDVIADRLAKHPEIKKVVDPVMIATSGARLISPAAVERLKEKLIPLATLVTPNLPEAEELGGDAKALYDKFGVAVLVKGGHRIDGRAIDVLYEGRDEFLFELPKITSPVSTHGTGCTLSAAIASELALGKDLVQAITGAKSYVHKAIANSYHVGENCGVLDF